MICTYCKKEITDIKKAKVFHRNKYNLVSRAYKKNIKNISMILCGDCLDFMGVYFTNRKDNVVNTLKTRLNNQSIYILFLR